MRYWIIIVIVCVASFFAAGCGSDSDCGKSEKSKSGGSTSSASSDVGEEYTVEQMEEDVRAASDAHGQAMVDQNAAGVCEHLSEDRIADDVATSTQLGFEGEDCESLQEFDFAAFGEEGAITASETKRVAVVEEEMTAVTEVENDFTGEPVTGYFIWSYDEDEDAWLLEPQTTEQNEEAKAILDAADGGGSEGAAAEG